MCACGKDRGIGSTDNDVYEETIGGLEDNELFAVIDTNAPLPILLVTSQVFDDGTGKQASMRLPVTVCSVLRLINPVPLSWQTEFMSNLMKMEMFLIPWKKRMKQRLFQKKNITMLLKNTSML